MKRGRRNARKKTWRKRRGKVKGKKGRKKVVEEGRKGLERGGGSASEEA